MITPDQQPNESAKAFSAFRIYCDLGPTRTTTAVAAKYGASRALMSRWSYRHAWVKRAAMWDASNEAVRRAAEAKALKEQADVWAQRQLEYRGKAWELSEGLLKKATEMLALPVVQRTVSDDGKTVIINPGKWHLGHAIQALKTVDELRRLLLGLHTEKTEISGPDNGPIAVAAASVKIEIPDNGRD